MLLIGESLNSSIPRIPPLLEAHDEAAITAIICAQAAAGADYLDINTAMAGKCELECMRWLIRLCESVGHCKTVIDSSDPDVVTAAAECATRPFIVNSVTADRRINELAPLIAARGASVICLPVCGTALPETADETVKNAVTAVGKLTRAGVAENKIFIDALVRAVATGDGNGRICLDTVAAVRRELPGVKTVLGLSNISFGLPRRRALNAAFMTLAVSAGVDAVIADVTDTRLTDALYAAELLLGEDEYCAEYIAYARDVKSRESRQQ